MTMHHDYITMICYATLGSYKLVEESNQLLKDQALNTGSIVFASLFRFVSNVVSEF